jgi:integrase
MEARGEKWKPSPWVFSSPSAENGRLAEPRIAHAKALRAAGLPHISLHGLRRSFGTLSEWVECPVGVVAQIQGHKPSAIAEKHYRRRPLDLLRLWHCRIEAWMLEQAGIEFKVDEAGEWPGLHAVK